MIAASAMGGASCYYITCAPRCCRGLIYTHDSDEMSEMFTPVPHLSSSSTFKWYSREKISLTSTECIDVLLLNLRRQMIRDRRISATFRRAMLSRLASASTLAFILPWVYAFHHVLLKYYYGFQRRAWSYLIAANNILWAQDYGPITISARLSRLSIPALFDFVRMRAAYWRMLFEISARYLSHGYVKKELPATTALTADWYTEKSLCSPPRTAGRYEN